MFCQSCLLSSDDVVDGDDDDDEIFRAILSCRCPLYIYFLVLKTTKTSDHRRQLRRLSVGNLLKASHRARQPCTRRLFRRHVKF